MNQVAQVTPNIVDINNFLTIYQNTSMFDYGTVDDFLKYVLDVAEIGSKQEEWKEEGLSLDNNLRIDIYEITYTDIDDEGNEEEGSAFMLDFTKKDEPLDDVSTGRYLCSVLYDDLKNFAARLSISSRAAN